MATGFKPSSFDKILSPSAPGSIITASFVLSSATITVFSCKGPTANTLTIYATCLNFSENYKNIQKIKIIKDHTNVFDQDTFYQQV